MNASLVNTIKGQVKAHNIEFIKDPREARASGDYAMMINSDHVQVRQLARAMALLRHGYDHNVRPAVDERGRDVLVHALIDSAGERHRIVVQDQQRRTFDTYYAELVGDLWIRARKDGVPHRHVIAQSIADEVRSHNSYVAQYKAAEARMGRGEATEEDIELVSNHGCPRPLNVGYMFDKYQILAVLMSSLRLGIVDYSANRTAAYERIKRLGQKAFESQLAIAAQ